MEQALILGKMSYAVPRDIISKFRSVPGVTEANLIFGPYDFYVLVNAETKDKVGDISLRIRSIQGITDTMTCYVVSLSEIRPEARGALVE